MSGGHFDYVQYRINEAAEQVDDLIFNNNSQRLDDYGQTEGREYSPEIIEQFKKGANLLRAAYIYLHRIDWLVSCDDGPESFLHRLEEDMQKLEIHEVNE